MAISPSNGWLYFKRLDVIDILDESNDYQIKLTIYSGTGTDNPEAGEIYCNNSCINFPDDIRFGTTNDPSSAIQLSQWIEEYDAIHAVVWIKLPSNGSDTIFMFLGNPNATQYSNINDVFIDDIDGVVGSWSLNEGSGTTAHDESSYSNDGTLVNNPNWVDGEIGSAVSFYGTFGYINCGNDASLNPTNGLTIETWVKFNHLDYSTNGGNLQGIAGKGHPDSPSPNYGWWFSYDNRHNGNSFSYTCFGNSSGGYNGGGNNFGAVHYTFNEDQWYHVAFTVDATTGEGKIFVNGNHISPTRYFSNLQLADLTRDLTIGLGATRLEGAVDEFRMYSRALTPTEINNIYNGVGYLTHNYPNHVLIRKRTSSTITWRRFGEIASIYLTPSKGWKYRKEIRIGDPDNISNDYQIKFRVYKGDGVDDPSSCIIYCNNQCEDFPNDIRFGTSNTPNTSLQLSQWIETQTSNYIDIWVKLPSDNSDTIYMYIGNEDASLYSSTLNTFISDIDKVVESLHFDEGSGTTAHDTSGYGNDGTLYNNPLWISGQLDGALKFNETNYVEVPHSASLDIRDNITLEALVKDPPAWLGNYMYRQMFTLSRPAGLVSDYQVKLIVHRGAGVSTGQDVYLNNHSASWPNDIRFTTSDAITELSYYIETYDASTAEIWVKFDTINTTDTTFYIYYGLTGDTSASDGQNTFIFFDDFETWSGWTQYGGGQVSQDTTRVFEGSFSAHKTTSNDPNGAYKNIGTTLGRNIALHFRGNRNSGFGGGASDRVGLLNASNNGYGFQYTHQSPTTLAIDRRNNYVGQTNSSVTASNIMDSWYRAEFRVTPSTLYSLLYQSDGTLDTQTSWNNTSYTNFNRVYIFGGYDYWIDQMFIRQYYSPEPSFGTWYSEEKKADKRIIISKDKNAYELSLDMSKSMVYGFISSSAVSSSIISPGDWHHLVMTYNGSSQNLFIDGSLVVNKPLSTILSSNTLDLSIGSLISGAIDEIRIYNDTLTASDVYQLANNYGYTTINYPHHVLIRKWGVLSPSCNVLYDWNRISGFYIHHVDLSFSAVDEL